MAIAIDIEIDPLPAQGSVQTIAGSLTGLEDQGKATGDALSKALAGLDAEGKAEEKIERLTRELEAEERILTSIRGPQQQYKDQLAALDKLLERDAISTHEYALQVTRLNQQLQASLPIFEQWDRKAHAAANAARAASTIGLSSKGVDPTKNPTTGKQSFGGQLSGFLGGELAAMAGPAALVGAGLAIITDELEKWSHREKVVKEAANSMLRYTSSIGDARKAVGEMRDLSRQLNSTLKETVAAYSSVRDATENLYISKKKVVDITRNLGMIMKLEDRAVGDSAQLLGQLQFAIDRGSISSGELTKLMKAFPPIAAIWRKEFGMTTNELLLAADNGDLAKKGLGRLVTALSDGSETVKKFSQRYLDYGAAVENADGDILKAQRNIQDYTKELKAAVNATKTDPFDELDAAMRKLEATSEAGDLKLKRLQETLARFDTLSYKASAGLKGLSDDIGTAFDLATGAIMTGKGGKGSDPWASDASFQKRMDQAREAMERYKAVLEQIKGPAKTFHQTIDILTNMLKSKTITLDEHAAAVRRAIDAYGGGDFLKQLEGSNNFYAPKKPWEQDAQAMAEYAADTEAVITIQQSLQTENEKTALKVAQLNELFQKGRLDAETYERAMQAIADSYERSTLKAEEFTKAAEKGMQERSKAQDDYEKRIQDMSQFVDKTLGQAFRAATDEFTNFCKTGEFNWSSLVETILEGLARVAAAELQSAIVRAIATSLVGAPPPGVTLSGSSGSSRVMSAPYEPSGSGGSGSSGGGGGFTPMMAPNGGANVTVINMLGDPRDQTLRTMDSRDGRTVTRNQIADSERLRRQR